MSGEVAKHMIAFRIHQQRRIQVEDYGAELAVSYLVRLRCEPLDRGIMSDDAHKYMKDFASFREIPHQGTIFIKLFLQYWDKIINVQSDLPFANLV